MGRFRLNRITLDGYKSIRHMALELRPLNVLIGPNGGGKSTLLSFFRLLREISQKSLQEFVGVSGGADSLLHFGAKSTPRSVATLEYNEADGTRFWTYHFSLQFSEPDSIVFGDESFEVRDERSLRSPSRDVLGTGHRETRLVDEMGKGNSAAGEMLGILMRCRAFHFHDTSKTSLVRRFGYLHENLTLRGDGGNLAAFLYRLRETEPPYYERIVRTIRLLAPWFGDFVLEPSPLNREMILLNWREANRDVTFGPHILPDGALRLMALVTLLLQPDEDVPPILVVDEPELGLHPAALEAVTGLLKAAALHRQVIVATQSVSMVDHFEPEDLVVVEREEGESTFRRLDTAKLHEWLEEYSLSELWEKNVIGGGCP